VLDQDLLPLGLPVVPAAMGSAFAPRAVEAREPVRERCAELEGHRGIAILAIVLFHVYQFCNVSGGLDEGTAGYRVVSNLDAAMPWFFVLTAFLLFDPIARSIIEARPPLPARTFLKRRAVRILPAYYVAVLVVWFPRQHSLPGDWRDLLEHLTFTQVFDGKRIFYTIGPASALSVDMYFYVVLAALGIGLTLACRRLTTRRGRIAVLSIAISILAAVSLTWKAWSWWIGHRLTTASPTTWYGPTANLDAFAVGLAVAVIAAAFGPVRPLQWRGRLVLRLVALAIVIIAFDTRQADSWSGVYFYSMCSVGFGCLVAAAVLGPAGDRWSRVLSCGPLTWLGAISYGVYLWHEPVMLALRSVDGLVGQAPGAYFRDSAVVLVVSILVGFLSYFFIERPASRIGSVFNRDGGLTVAPFEAGGVLVEWETFRSGNPL
jgi:peptidoglycan/LPS O-acetylase OafA/YrhL